MSTNSVASAQISLGTRDELLAAFASDVRAGLGRPGQKELPSKYLYDDVGSALFEVICVLSEYGVTRAGIRLLQKNAEAIAERLPARVVVAELGSGTGKKTRLVLQALAARQPLKYFPIDVSGAALAQCRLELSQIEDVTIIGVETGYLEGLQYASRHRAEGEALLLLFLGSGIGNFSRGEGVRFLRDVRASMREGDRMLLATDLMKPVPDLLAAYDDPSGTTAAFNRNLLSRMNRELGADFVVRQFEHVARFDPGERRIEMHLRSTADQTVRVEAAALTVHFEKGETIWTESSHKYTPEDVQRLATETGFTIDAQWVDGEWAFAQSLLVAR